MFENALKHRSGRVIALARLALAAVFLLAIWVVPAQPPLGGSGRPSFAPIPSDESEEPADEPQATAAATRKPPTRLMLTANHHVVSRTGS